LIRTIAHPNWVWRSIFWPMFLPCPSRDNGNRISEFPEGCALASSPRVGKMNEKALCNSRYDHLQGCGMANLAKTMPFACCPPAFVRSHGGGLFSPQTSQKQLFLRKQVGAPKWIPC
jgi:hypothetical protein